MNYHLILFKIKKLIEFTSYLILIVLQQCFPAIKITLIQMIDRKLRQHILVEPLMAFLKNYRWNVQEMTQ